MEDNNLGIYSLNASGSYWVGEYWFYSSELEYISVSEYNNAMLFTAVNVPKAKCSISLGDVPIRHFLSNAPSVFLWPKSTSSTRTW